MHRNKPFILSGPRKAFLLLFVAFAFMTTPVEAIAQTKSALQKLTGWAIPGLENIDVLGVKTGKNYFSAELPAVANGRVKPVIVGYKSANQSKYNVGIVLGQFHLGDFASAIKSTPLNDLLFSKMILLAIPRENGDRQVNIPTELQAYLGKKPIKKPAGVKLFAAVKVVGKIQEMVAKVGIRPGTLNINGKINPGIFAGKFKGAALKQAFLDALDLTLPLPALRPNWRPSFLSFKSASLSLKGHKNAVTASIATEIDIKAKKTLVFAPVTITYDTGARKLTLTGTQAKNSAALSIPLKQASISGLAFSAEIDSQTKKFALAGDLKLNGKTHAFHADLSGGHTANYEIGLSGDFTLADFGAGNLPGLDKIKVTDPKIASHFASADVSIGSVKTTLVVYTPEGKRNPNVALLSDGLKLSDLAPGAKGTALDDLQLAKSAFVIVPKDNTGENVTLPEAVSSHLDVTTMTLKPGVNIRAAMSVVGEPAKILSALKLPTKNLPLTGKFDPSIFKQPKSLGKAFIENLDLNVPINKLKIPGAPSVLKLSNSALVIKGEKGGIAASVAADVSIKAGGKTFSFEQASLSFTEANGQKTFEMAGTSTNKWTHALGLSWLTLSEIGLDVKLGKEQDIAISGTTSMGRVKNLKASANLEIKGGKVADFGIALSGADIPLNVIPSLSKLPNAGDFGIRDLVISEKEFAGTTVSTKHKAFDGLRTVIFDTGGSWNFAILRQNFSLADIIPVGGPAKGILKRIKMTEAAVVISNHGFNEPVSNLPPAAAEAMEKIFGASTATAHVVNGINLMASVDPKVFGKGLSDLATGGKGGHMAFVGSVGGVFGGTPSVDLAVDIPQIKMPKSLSFLILPKEIQTAFFVKLEGADADFGAEIIANLELKTKHETVQFDTTIAFEADTEGSLAFDVQGKTDSDWKNAFGIKGFTLNTGTRMEIKANASSEVDLTFVGKSHLGSKEVDVTASVGIVDGIPDKAAFEGKVSELGLGDIMALVNDVAGATGGKKADLSKLPTIKLTDVDYAFASPGTDVPEMNLTGGGMRFAGKLWFLYKNAPLLSFKSQIDATGLTVDGTIHDIKAGPIALKNTKLDLAAGIKPPKPPQFKIQGEIDLFKAKLDAELEAALNEISFSTSIDDGPLLIMDIKATLGTSKLSFSPSELAKFDMSLRAELKSDFHKWLSTEGKKAVKKVFGGIEKGFEDIVKGVTKAKTKVDKLQKKIDSARKKVKARKKKALASISSAQKSVNSTQKHVNSLNSDIKKLKHKLSSCNYKKRICTWYNVIKRRCTHHKNVPDLIKSAKCESRNAKYGIEIAGKGTALGTATAALTTAKGFLKAVKAGEKIAPVDLDPTVAPLITAKATADAALTVAKEAAKGAESVTKKLESGLEKLTQVDIFTLKEGLLQGSLKGMIHGKPVILSMDAIALNKEIHFTFGFNPSNLKYTAEQFETLALYLGVKAVEALHGKDPASKSMLNLLHKAYAKAHGKVEAEVAKVKKMNKIP
jgi:hypothetical protein